MRTVRRESSPSQPVPSADAHPMTVAMVQALIPLGLQAVEEALQAEVTALAGPAMRARPPRRGWSAGARSQARST